MSIVEATWGLFSAYRNHSDAKSCSAKMTSQTPRPSFISQYRLLCLVSGLSSGLPLLMLDSLTATSNAKCHLSKSCSEPFSKAILQKWSLNYFCISCSQGHWAKFYNRKQHFLTIQPFLCFLWMCFSECCYWLVEGVLNEGRGGRLRFSSQVFPTY